MTAQLEIRPPELEADQTVFDFERNYTLEEFFTLDLPEYDEDGDEVEYELVKPHEYLDGRDVLPDFRVKLSDIL
jgi:hypothetical protein